MPALMAAWLAETGSVTRCPGPMARASHGMDAAAQDTANRMLIASTGAGLAARDMDAIAPRAAPVACLPVAAGIVVSIQIMPPAISVWNRAGRLGRQPRPEPARLVSPNQSAAHPNKAACSHVAAAGSDRQIIAIRAAHIAPQKTAETHSASCADSAGARHGSVA